MRRNSKWERSEENGTERTQPIDFPKIERSWSPWRSRDSNFAAEEERGHRPGVAVGDEDESSSYKEMIMSLLASTGLFNISDFVLARSWLGQDAPGAPPIRRAHDEVAGGARGNGRGARPGGGPAGLRGQAPIGGLEQAAARRSTRAASRG